ncbi:MAG TPA: carboxymuconolactone decarboxylase family protein [Nitrospira sp.]|nr:carboxymuconolactone decarboxylase family protein [Nitrospira sp.]
MALVRLLQDDQVDTEVASIFKIVDREYGFTPNILRAISHCPDLLKTFLPLWAEVYRSKGIGRRMRAILALGTAFAQDCSYCIGPMRQSAINAGLDAKEIDCLGKGQVEGLGKKEAIVFRFAQSLTRDPSAVEVEVKKDFDDSFNEEEKVQIVLGIGMYNLTARVLKGLEVELDPIVKVKKDAGLKANVVLPVNNYTCEVLS